jgi:hypothetical protein
MIKMIGGKCDGNEVPAKVLMLTEDGESYLLMSFKEGEQKHFFYMLAGMVPAEAMKTYKLRAGLTKPKVEAAK